MLYSLHVRKYIEHIDRMLESKSRRINPNSTEMYRGPYLRKVRCTTSVYSMRYARNIKT